MDNSVKKLIELLEPLICDIDELKKYLNERKRELENVSRMLAYTKDNFDMVGIYADQDLILNNLSRINSNKEDYRASCYLLNSENESVKHLPQYQKAYELISDIIEYFKLYKAELIVETGDIEEKCREKDKAKKYYNIFSNNDPYIVDIKEFNDFLDSIDLINEDKINILIYIIENNYKHYKKSS